MKLSELSPVYAEALSVHQAFRRLGFATEQIYAEISRAADVSEALVQPVTDPDAVILHIVLRQDGKQFVVPIGIAGDDAENAWLQTAALAREASEEELQESFDTSLIRTHIVALLSKLIQKGFRVGSADRPELH